jgi:hypothetical protein
MSMKRLVLAPLALSLLSVCPPAGAADIVGAWQIHGSVFFNAVDTICHFRREESGVTATCESDGVLGPFTPATISGGQVVWSWDAGPAILTFEAKLTSDATMKGEIKVRGFTGGFTATRQ